MISREYDLEDRTLRFALWVREFVSGLIKSDVNRVYIRQLVRSSSSIGANYIEANESLSRKDFVHRIKIAKKEAKESIYWLKLLVVPRGLEGDRMRIANECVELMRIFGSIIEKSK